MKRYVLGFSAITPLVLALAVIGCGQGSDPPDGGNGLPDGFVSNNCTMVEDCAPTKCQTAKCNPVTKMCEYKTKTCTSEGTCTKGVCDENADGACVQQPDHEGMTCMTMDGDPGMCLTGTCTAVPTCAPASAFVDDAECDADDASVKQSSNAPMSFGGGAPVIGAYPCAPTEAGPEIAFRLNHDSSAGDEDITVSIKPVNADGTPASADDKDLDLIVLEDACTGTAVCMNPTVTGGFRGVTAGTAFERVTFRAMANKEYYIVVDGKDMNQIRDFELEVEACGKCQPTDTTRLSCNMTMPISKSTADGAAQITDYKCGMAMTPVAAAGKEIPFLLRTTDNAVRNVTASLTGPSADYRLMVMPTSVWGQCQPDSCIDFKNGPAATTLTWKVDPSFNGFAKYWVVVDSPSVGTDASFGLQLTCAPYCLAPYSLNCLGGSETKIVQAASTADGPKQASKWGPAAGCDGLTGLVGPEKAVQFTTAAIVNTDYELRLASKTAGKNLTITLLDGGTTMDPACDPTMACRVNTVVSTAGFTGTRTTNSNTTPAAIRFTAEPGHTYFAIVDSVDAAGGSFDLQVVGVGGGAGCQ